MAKSTDIKVKLSSVDEVKQFVDVMRGYHGDVDISATNKNYMVDAKSILGVISLDLRDELTVKFYDGISDSTSSRIRQLTFNKRNIRQTEAIRAVVKKDIRS